MSRQVLAVPIPLPEGVGGYGGLEIGRGVAVFH